MKTFYGVLLALVAVASANDPACPSNWWTSQSGASLLCGCCANGSPCDIKTGQCPGGCAPGYSGPDCTEPTCNDVSCGEGVGHCYKPNECVCAKNYAQSDDGGCHSMRTAGLKGAFASLLIIITAITICGTIQHQRMKGRTPE
ncbi:Oidioi.mRNA.OKI2018_I69.chr1.g1075.t1.cds [Oikopleura dioica]|uniref:Oidioi.mRNA.OKI2018_I69.chr1.g1075.t1.cds n=1 Tax=Oikopleura dioica TaxID=34765 RepID=A0ABN7STY0_OIKDI|nr:Oidioi.mRNA.OKI2018_I69.chr1.g1075.t1.cds [Oikopleura dioica]